MTAPDIPPGFDLTDPDLYTTRVPAQELAELRRAAPVWWVTQRPSDSMPDIAKAGDPVRLRSGWINGIKHLPVSYRG